MTRKKTAISRICLVTADEALIPLISFEAQELSLTFSVYTSVKAFSGTAAETLWLLDYDDEEGRAAASVLPTTAMRVLIGRGLADSADGRILHRPFETSRLRQILLSFAMGARTTATQALPQDYEALPSDLLLVMENETTLRCGTRQISLTPKEAAIMRCLIAHRGEIVEREMLDQCLGGASQSNKAEVYLCFLRRKLEMPSGCRLITTVRGRGYRLE